MVSSVEADFAALYQASDLCKRNAEEADRLAKASLEGSKPLTLSSTYAVSRAQQARILLKHFLISYWRSPSYNLVRMVVTVLVGIILGTLFRNAGEIRNRDVEDDLVEPRDVQNLMGVIFMSISFMGMINMVTILPVVGAQRAVYYRERAASMYSSYPFAVASGLVEIPYLIAQTILFVPPVYFFAEFANDVEKFMHYLIMFFQTISLYTFLGQMLVYVTPSEQLAQVVGAGSHFIWQLFNGFVIAEPKMPRGWKWMNKITPTTYIIYGLTVSQLGDSDAEIDVLGTQNATLSEYLEDTFGYEFSFRWWTVGILFLFIVTFRVITVYGLAKLNFQRR